MGKGEGQNMAHTIAGAKRSGHIPRQVARQVQLTLKKAEVARKKKAAAAKKQVLADKKRERAARKKKKEEDKKRKVKKVIHCHEIPENIPRSLESSEEFTGII